MRRLVITFSAAVLVLSIAPAGALARHQHRGHQHRRHHSRVHHARIECFGGDVTSAPSSSSSADNAGTLQSFHNGVLTIRLGNGSTVSGAVTGDTELECMAPGNDRTVHEDGDGGSGHQSGDGDNSGSGDGQAQSSGDQSSSEDQGDAAEQNENQAEERNENEAGNNCSTMNLTPGTVVREAELRISGAGPVWKKVELSS
jgi:hypothetical protein